MAAAGKRFDSHVYEGAPHAFFNDSRAGDATVPTPLVTHGIGS